jgi:23S rRNA (adenine2503-C2)-methyltransferase
MKVISKTEEHNIASVYIARNDAGKLFEFVESTQPPLTIGEKWVLIISTLFGCPVDCKFCDAGGNYRGRLSYEELIFQIDYLIRSRFPDLHIHTKRLKIQFARMGEPLFNPAVLKVLKDLPERYDLPEFSPSLSTIGPVGSGKFLEELIKIKKELYPDTFQLQFSIHSTDTNQRDALIPVHKMSFDEIAGYGKEFYVEGGKKITLNFALSEKSIVSAEKLARYFDPGIFIIKVTPLNPTFKAQEHGLKSNINHDDDHPGFIKDLHERGFETILSIGAWEENRIGSNCGQYINTYLNSCSRLEGGYASVLTPLT